MSDVPSVTVWTLNPAEQVFTAEGPDGSIYSATLEDLTAGAFRLSGRNIVNASTGKFAGNVNTYGASQLIVNDDGTYLLVNQTDEGKVTSFGKQSLVNAASLEATFTNPDGTSTDVNINYANINRIGKQLIINDTDVNNVIYRWLDIGQTELPPGFRRATPTEAIQYGLGNAIIRQYRSLVTNLADSGIEDENGNPIETITDAAYYIVNMLAAQATYAKIFQLGR